MTTDEKLDKIIAMLTAMGTRPAAASSSGPPTTLPGYGRSAGAAIATAELADLQWYASNCKKSLDDPGKAKWHERERAMLAALEAEIMKRGKAPAGAPSTDDESIPF